MAAHKPIVVVDVLKEFTDIILPKLPKPLTPHRDVDHRIELKLEVKPIVRPPYYMTSLELAKLKK